MSENRLRGTVVFLQTKKQTEKNMENNKNMNPIFSLKNFRSFGEDGADFELAPITVLTGCNSAGKSSLVKALMLLNKLPKGDELESPALKLYASDLSLGSFDKVLYNHARENRIELSYKVWSYYLQEMVTVKMTFGTYKNDAMNDGFRNNLVILNDKGAVIYDQSDYMKDWHNEFEWAKCIGEEYIAFSGVNSIHQLKNLSDKIYFVKALLQKEIFFFSSNIKES